jgi:hypothetical protein
MRGATHRSEVGARDLDAPNEAAHELERQAERVERVRSEHEVLEVELALHDIDI